jgi:hypothetical protein
MLVAPTSSIINFLVALLRESWVDELWWLAKMFVSQAHLKSGFERIHSAGASAQTRTGQRFNLSSFRFVVAMNCDQSSPHGEINVVSALNVHRYSHRRRMGDERMSRMTCRYDDACANRLLAKVILKNALLDKFHYMLAKKSDYRQVHTGVHKPERIPCRDNTIEGRQILKSSADNLNFRVLPKLPAQHIAKLRSSIYKNESHASYSSRV